MMTSEQYLSYLLNTEYPKDIKLYQIIASEQTKKEHLDNISAIISNCHNEMTLQLSIIRNACQNIISGNYGASFLAWYYFRVKPTRCNKIAIIGKLIWLIEYSLTDYYISKLYKELVTMGSDKLINDTIASVLNDVDNLDPNHCELVNFWDRDKHKPKINL